MVGERELAAQPAGGVTVARARRLVVIGVVKSSESSSSIQPGDDACSVAERHLEARQRIGEVRVADAFVDVLRHQPDGAGARSAEPLDVAAHRQRPLRHRRDVQRREPEDPAILVVRAARHDVERAGQAVTEAHRQHAAVEIEAADHRRVEHA